MPTHGEINLSDGIFIANGEELIPLSSIPIVKVDADDMEIIPIQMFGPYTCELTMRLPNRRVWNRIFGWPKRNCLHPRKRLRDRLLKHYPLNRKGWELTFEGEKICPITNN